MSHIQGSDYVGSMVVLEDGLPKKSEYRRFKIKGDQGNDDFAAMEQVLTRRLTAYLAERRRPVTETAGKFSYPPQLLLVDGGKGQLSVAVRVLEELGLADEIPVASLAKRFEEVYVPGEADPIRLPRQSEALYLLQRIRDEAHRFAITFHRELRGKRMTTSVLDGISGLGEVRRKRLVKELGGIKAVKAASREDLEALPVAPGLGRARGVREDPRAFVNGLDRALARPPTWRAIVVLAIAIRTMFVIAPFDVLHPVDAHVLGQLVLHGDVPYRDFGLEYPPGSILAMLLPGLAPAWLAPSVLALQAVACEVIVWWALGDDASRRRFLLLSTLAFPVLSGGFDAVSMAALAVSTGLLTKGDDRGWWVAAFGASVKVFPGIAWGWMPRWGRTGVAALAVTIAILLAPMAIGEGRDVYVNYHADRGVQQESIAASATHLHERVTGGEAEVAYRFRAQEIVGAERSGTICPGRVRRDRGGHRRPRPRPPRRHRSLGGRAGPPAGGAVRVQGPEPAVRGDGRPPRGSRRAALVPRLPAHRRPHHRGLHQRQQGHLVHGRGAAAQPAPRRVHARGRRHGALGSGGGRASTSARPPWRDDWRGRHELWEPHAGVVAGRVHRGGRPGVRGADPSAGRRPPRRSSARARRRLRRGADRSARAPRRRRGRHRRGSHVGPGEGGRRARRGSVLHPRRSGGAAVRRPVASMRSVACLVFEHITDVDAAIGEVARVLAPGGRFLFFLNHPLLQTPNSGWIDDQILDPPEQYWRIGPYLVEDETIEEVEKGVFIPFIHRPLSRYVNALADAGLVLHRMEEPAPPPGFLARAAEYEAAATIPRLLFLHCEKT